MNTHEINNDVVSSEEDTIICGGVNPHCDFSFEENDVTPTGDFWADVEEATKYKNIYLNEQDLEIRKRLIKLGLLELILPPYNSEHIKFDIQAFKKNGILADGEPIYIYLNYKESRKNKLLPVNDLIGNWQFKMFLLKNPEIEQTLDVMEEFPILKECLDFTCVNIRKIKKRLKEIFRKEYVKLIQGSPNGMALNLIPCEPN